METLISKNFLTWHMDAKIVKVTDKGQISLPISMRNMVGIKKGDKLLLVQSGKIIVIEKLGEDRYKDLLKHSEKLSLKLWGGKENEVWDKL